MLEFAAVITTGGLLLFSNAIAVEDNLFLNLVNRIIDSKNFQSNFVLQALQINYLYDAILGFIFIIAWRKEISLDYPQKLLQAMSLEWKAVESQIVWHGNLMMSSPSFKDCFARAYQNWIDYVNQNDQKGIVMVKFGEKKQDKKQRIKEEEKNQLKNAENEVKAERTHEQEQQEKEKKKSEEEWDNLSPRERLLKRQQENKKNKATKESPKKDENEKSPIRTWENGKVSKKDIEQLDRSKKNRDSSPPPINVNKYLEEKEQKIAGFLDSDEEQEEKEPSGFLKKWVGKLKDVVGDKKITREDLNEVLQDFKQKLMEKNVAQEVAIQLSEAVGETLLLTKTKSFTSVHKTVKEAMKEALRKVLTPKRKIDLVVEVTKEREKLKPYVIVFIGVNGVGKSTNLAKVAYKLKNAKLSVMLAACDNFRAGAVEQIETHGRNLDIPVFQKGYKEEPANIAYEAIKDATKKRIDAVLVDTAGRMQDNAPLMKELARLVRLNKPNLVVFIGEALVGNDAVDQITKFNKALQEESTETFKPEIDAILLSKFDTVDDKVGAALSLIYSTSKPILYVGVGQKYPNLKELNVNTVVNALLS